MSLERSDLGALNVAKLIELPHVNAINNKEEVDICTALLATAVIRLRSHGKTSPPLRALCDSGSQANMISTIALEQLRWRTQRCQARFNGINGISGNPLTRKIVCDLLSRFDDRVLATIELVAMPQLSAMWLPGAPILKEMVPTDIRGKLADPTFGVPAPLEVLLGAGVWAVIMLDGKRIDRQGIALQPSHLGWLMFGGGVQAVQELQCAAIIESLEELTLDRQLQRFWELEEASVERKPTTEQRKCEEIFMRTHQRLTDGRYQVTLPIRDEATELGSSRAVALHRFLQLEKRFERNTELKAKYVTAMEELQRNDQMRLVSRAPIGPCYHIPHHAVLKKFREVFDASCRTDRGVSLNEIQLVGEKLQEDLAPLIMRFRCKPIAITADIKKMYLQVKIHPDQWDLQRVFWRASQDDEIQEYWLTGVTFGVSSAPHCAVRAMVQGARDLAAQYPQGAAAVQNDFYMDDCLTGAQQIEEARLLCAEIDALLGECGFELDKWRSNQKNVVPKRMKQQTSEVLELNELGATTVLGLRWFPETDHLTFKFEPPPALSAKEMTKRRLL